MQKKETKEKPETKILNEVKDQLSIILKIIDNIIQQNNYNSADLITVVADEINEYCEKNNIDKAESQKIYAISAGMLMGYFNPDLLRIFYFSIYDIYTKQNISSSYNGLYIPPLKDTGLKN